jgi:hypothetical protein
MPTARPLATHRASTVLLAGLAALILAYGWHSLAVWASFPIGGAEFHWVFQRPRGGDSRAAYIVGSVYGLTGLALAFFLCASSRWRAVSTVTAVVLFAAVFSRTMVVSSPDPEDLLVIPITGALLSVVAWLLWRVRRALAAPWRIVLAGIPGAWSLWEMYRFPYASSPSFRRALLPLVVVYPLVFGIASWARWRVVRPGPSLTETEAAQ